MGELVRADVTTYLLEFGQQAEAHQREFARDIRRARRSLQKLRALCTGKEREEEDIGLVRNALAEYVQCLEAWAEAAIADESLDRLNSIGGGDLTKFELAYLLQDDNLGCQTAYFRLCDAVISAHSEEDHTVQPGKHTNRLVKINCSADDSETLFVNYAHLLSEGSSVCVTRRGAKVFVQMTDYIPLADRRARSPILANCIVWLAWRLADRMSAAQLVQILQEKFDLRVRDSYAIHQQTGEGTSKVVFCGQHREESVLGDAAGSYMYTTGSAPEDEPADGSTFAGYANIEEAKVRARKSKRIERNIRRLKFLRFLLEGVTFAGQESSILEVIQRLMSRNIQNDIYGNANDHVIGSMVIVWRGDGFDVYLTEGSMSRDQGLENYTESTEICFADADAEALRIRVFTKEHEEESA